MSLAVSDYELCHIGEVVYSPDMPAATHYKIPKGLANWILGALGGVAIGLVGWYFTVRVPDLIRENIQTAFQPYLERIVTLEFKTGLRGSIKENLQQLEQLLRDTPKKPTETKIALGFVDKIVGEAQKSGVADAEPIAKISHEVAQFEKSSDPPTFWKSAALLINARFMDNTQSSPRYCFPPDLLPPDHYSDHMIFGGYPTGPPHIAEDCTQILDPPRMTGILYRNMIFKRSHLVYNGGDVTFDRVQCEDCTFEYRIPSDSQIPAPSGIRLGRTLLASSGNNIALNP